MSLALVEHLDLPEDAASAVPRPLLDDLKSKRRDVRFENAGVAEEQKAAKSVTDAEAIDFMCLRLYNKNVDDYPLAN